MAQHAVLHRHRHAAEDTGDTTPTEASARDTYGGTNWGACFFGWLVAVGVIVLLAAIASAVAAGIGHQLDWSRSDAEDNAGSVGLGAAIALVVIVFVGYYAGGYVAGRMSRFDGGRQGVLVWVIGVLATAIAVGLGWAFGAKYNLLDRVDLPRIPIPHDQLTWGGVLAGVIALLGTLLAAVAGGKVGRHYHDRVDTYAGR